MLFWILTLRYPNGLRTALLTLGWIRLSSILGCGYHESCVLSFSGMFGLCHPALLTYLQQLDNLLVALKSIVTSLVSAGFAQPSQLVAQTYMLIQNRVQDVSVTQATISRKGLEPCQESLSEVFVVVVGHIVHVDTRSFWVCDILAPLKSNKVINFQTV